MDPKPFMVPDRAAFMRSGRCCGRRFRVARHVAQHATNRQHGVGAILEGRHQRQWAHGCTMVGETGLGFLRYMHPLGLIDGDQVRERRSIGHWAPCPLTSRPCTCCLTLPLLPWSSLASSKTKVILSLADFRMALYRLDMIVEHQWRRMPLSGMELKHPVREIIRMRAWLQVW